jgi:hypothetical protein
VQVTRSQFRSDATNLPFIRMSSGTSIDSVFILHGFGGCKEELLGLGFRLAESGFNTHTVSPRRCIPIRSFSSQRLDAWRNGCQHRSCCRAPDHRQHGV